MTPFHVKVLTGFAILLTLLAAGDLAMAQSHRAPSAAPARDGNIAIQEELDAARKAATREAYDLFIARHPAHPLAAAAKQERERLPARR